MKIDTIVRRATRFLTGGASTIRATNMESVAVAQYEPFNADSTRAGLRFGGGNSIIANGIAPVAAIPTTTATLALYNADPNVTLYLDSLNFWLGSGTAAAGATLFGCVSGNAIATAPTAMATGYAVSSLSGSSKRSNALFAAAVTIPTASYTPAWVALSSNFQAAAANVGQGDGYRELNGAIAIPPLRAFGIGILSGAGTSPLYGISLTWVEIPNSGDLE
jgi:hypothetical protein